MNCLIYPPWPWSILKRTLNRLYLKSPILGATFLSSPRPSPHPRKDCLQELDLILRCLAEPALLDHHALNHLFPTILVRNRIFHEENILCLKLFQLRLRLITRTAATVVARVRHSLTWFWGRESGESEPEWRNTTLNWTKWNGKIYWNSLTQHFTKFIAESWRPASLRWTARASKSRSTPAEWMIMTRNLRRTQESSEVFSQNWTNAKLSYNTIALALTSCR